VARTSDTTTSARTIAGLFVALTPALGGSMVNVVELNMAFDEQL
jgi:K+-transporting ATPase c subunit